MKVLYVTTIGSTMEFFVDILKQLLDKGGAIDIATNSNIRDVPRCYKEWGCKIYQMDWQRSPLRISNIHSIKKLKELVLSEKYDVVHCHTPIAAMCARVACKTARKRGTKVFYTAHGFHFYKGAPIKNWLLYYPIEWFCAFLTDILITINIEDYFRAKKHLHAKRVEYVPGVGIDIDYFQHTSVDREKKRKELLIPIEAFLLLSVGELNTNKNHQLVIRALAELNNPDIHYGIAGRGDLAEDLQKLAIGLGVKEQVHFLEYRDDIAEIYKIADAYVLPSHREGLNVSVMEAIASGLPTVCSRIRGNVDLLNDADVLFDPTSIDECKQALEKVIYSNTTDMVERNLKKVRAFESKTVKETMIKMYLK